MKCTMCGYTFRQEEAIGSCSGCFMAGTCNKVHCPNCNFEVAINPFEKDSDSNHQPKECSHPIEMSTRLTDIKSNSKLTITSIDMKNLDIIKKLAALGLLPGTEIEVTQRYPSYILEIDNTTITIDKKLASYIHVNI